MPETKSAQNPNDLARRVRTQQQDISKLRERLERQSRQLQLLGERFHALASGLPETASRTVAPPPLPKPRPSSPLALRAPAPDPAIWPVFSSSARPLGPTPGIDNYTLHGAVKKVLGISVCGFGHDDLERIVDLIERQQRQSRDFIPVFLTDSTDSDVFRSHGYVFEYLPPPDRVRTRGGKTWADYAAERRRLLARKWGMTDIITFGELAFGRPTENWKIRRDHADSRREAEST